MMNNIKIFNYVLYGKSSFNYSFYFRSQLNNQFFAASNQFFPTLTPEFMLLT